MDFNTILSINQTIHNAGAALFSAGPFYFLLLLSKGRVIGGDFSPKRALVIEDLFGASLSIWIVFIVLQGLSGAAFGLLSIVYEGSIPEVSAIAMTALIIKVLAAAGAFFISVYLKIKVAPVLRAFLTETNPNAGSGEGKISGYLALSKHRGNLIWVLMFLGAIALTGAAFLRWNL